MRYAANYLLSSMFIAGALAIAIPAHADFLNDAQRYLNQGNQSQGRDAYEQGRRDEMRQQQVDRDQHRAMREQQRDREYGQSNRYGDRYDDRYGDRHY